MDAFEMVLPSTTLATTHIRWMVRDDLESVLAIELVSNDPPWSMAEFIDCHNCNNTIGMVAERGGKVVGFMVYELHKTSIHLINLAVEPRYRRRGIGTELIRRLAGKLSLGRRTWLSVRMPLSNQDGLKFLRRRRFLATKIFQDDTGEDIIDMEFVIEGD